MIYLTLKNIFAGTLIKTSVFVNVIIYIDRSPNKPATRNNHPTKPLNPLTAAAQPSHSRCTTLTVWSLNPRISLYLS